jgi:membrane-associated protease RseP (regulator of RpoE activity)
VAPVTDEQRQMYNAFFEVDDSLHRAIDDEALEGMYRAQTTWDATMGWNALQALQENGGPNAIMVVLIGSGHVTFGLGAERQTAPHYDGKISSIIPISVFDDVGEPVREVRASYANFIWGLPKEQESEFPTLGISLMGSLGDQPMQLIQVSAGSVGDQAGLIVGDVLVSIDGTAIESAIALRKLVSGYRWGDVVVAEIRRDDELIPIEIQFRRTIMSTGN